ncbi:MAG: NIL domain-containing protein [Enterocloster clostridioformis]
MAIPARFALFLTEGSLQSLLIANMVLACRVPVNIMHADTRDIEGKAMGRMLIQLPEDDTDAGQDCNYLKTANVKFEEVR